MRRPLLLVLALAAILAGCAAPAPPAPTARIGGSGGGGPLGVSIMAPEEFDPHAGASAVLEPAEDPDAPPVTLDGQPSWAAAMHVHEQVREGRPGQPPRTVSRGLCGGAVLAVPEGAPDPRHDLSRLEYVQSHRLTTEDGRAWITDEYRVGDTGRAWVANVLGGETFHFENGRFCEAPLHGEKPYNVLLHAPEKGNLQAWLLTHERPARPSS